MGSGERNLDQWLEQALETLEGAFHRLILVSGGPDSGKTQELRRLAQRVRSPAVNLNLELSRQLLELNVRERSLRAAAVVADLIEGAGDIVILDNTEILFDRALALDPLRMFQRLSRNRTIVASWVGSLSERRLTYAEPGHPEFRSYREVDAVIIDLAERGLTEE